MAKTKPESKRPNADEPNRLLYYDALHFIPVEQKNERWAAEVIYFAKQSSEPFQNSQVYRTRKQRDKNIIDANAYKKIVDPLEGKAEYFSADWKGNPIFVHLNNIIDAKTERTRNNIMVKAADEFSKMNQQRENEKILGQKNFRAFINEMNSQFGFPPLGDNEDPFAYVERIGMEDKLAEGSKQGPGASMPTGMIDSLKSAIEDNEDLALFNEYLWKDGVEIASEIGIEHYLFVLNRFLEYSEDILSDIRLINRYILRFYTSKTTGLPVLERMEPDRVWVSKFKKKDGSDMIHWFTEYDVSFGDFVRMFGAKLSPKQLREVFDLNRQSHGIRNYEKCSFSQRNNASIRIGYIEFESQDMEVWSDWTYKGNPKFQKEAPDYQPSEHQQKKFGAKRVESNYNVWRSCYYLPLIATEQMAGSTDFSKQAQYIYDLGKLQDQQRYGADFRYAKNSLITFASEKPSWFEIMDEFMPIIHLLWNQAKNDWANAMPHGLLWFEEFLTSTIAMVDEAEKDGKDLKGELINKIRQTGSGIARRFARDNEQNQGQEKPFMEIKTGHLETATERINSIMVVYQLMTRALGISEVSEGMDPKARQSLGGIQMAAEGTSNATYSIDRAYSKAIIQAGERLLYYFKEIVDEGESERLQDFVDIVGQANGMAMKSIKDIPTHKLGLRVDNIITDEQKAMVNQLASQLASAGMLEPDIALFITQVDNLKYSYAILRLKMKQKAREIEQSKQAERDYQLQLKQMDLQFVMQKQQDQNQAMFQIKEMQMQWEAKLLELETMLKTQGQSQIKDKITEGRIQEKVVDHQLKTG